MAQWHEVTAEERETCVRVLQAIAEDPSVIAGDERMKALISKIHRNGKKAERKSERAVRVEADRALRGLTATVQRDLQARPLAEAPTVPPQAVVGALCRATRCYVCKAWYHELHFFYHLLCPHCAEVNYARRQQRAHLAGRVALVTGGRIKIGHRIALAMLRDGARVIVTTRFPGDAARRFALEEDYAEWRDRLELAGLDLRNLPSGEGFARRLLDTEPHLDILINNAAQTVKRPLAFYQHLLAGEETRPVLLEALLDASDPARPMLPIGKPRAGSLAPAATEVLAAYFPPGALDPDGQQVDCRPENSWSLRLHQVGTLEMIETHLVNAVAPFILCRELKPLLLRSPHPRRFIVNVSAMEGQFARVHKTERHPHTNMAKAALNMLTRTSAADLARDGIYMNSVDTGWITDEKPHERKLRHQETGFFTPLDVIDGAARVYDPIVRGVSDAEEPCFGQFLKDYAPYPW